MNSAQVIFEEQDLSFFVESQIQGIGAVLLKTKRGQYGIRDDIYTSWAQFVRHYGGESLDFPGATLVKRAITKGASLRIVKIGHYTTIANPSTLDAVKAAIDESGPDFAIVTGAIDAFDLIIKYPGADYNNIQVIIAAASNGDTNSFNLQINHLIESDLNELYENLTIPGTPSVANSHYLDDITSKSELVDVVYKDLSAQTAPLRPANGTWNFIGGTNGGTIVDADYAGDPGGTGIYFLNNFDDFEVFAAFDNESTALYNSMSTYVASRQDCVGLVHIPNSNDSVAENIAFRTGLTADSRYLAFFTGGVKIRNPYVASDVNTPINISELGDVMGIACKSSAQFGPWWSFAGTQRGLITDIVGIVNNFAPGGPSRLNQLAQKQINAVVSINNNYFVKGNFSGQKATSRKSFLNVVKLLIYIRKSLRPTLEKYLEQPNDFRTFRELYNEVDPFFRSLASTDKRALVDYEWRGDQFANKDSELKINNRTDLDAGKYVVELWLKETVSLQEMTIKIISAPSGVTFESNVNQ